MWSYKGRELHISATSNLMAVARVTNKHQNEFKHNGWSWMHESLSMTTRICICWCKNQICNGD